MNSIKSLSSIYKCEAEDFSTVMSRRQEYFNGNYFVIRKPGYLEKIALRSGEDLVAEFPDSIDLKITNKCSWGCPFCHESSSKEGKSFDPDKTKQILCQLPQKPVEIALGGGNILENIEDTITFLDWLGKTPWLPRITVNMRDLKNKDLYRIADKVSGLGISVDSLEDLKKIFADCSQFQLPFHKTFHIICGVFPEESIDDLIDYLSELDGGNSLLFLGYKSWGRGKTMEPGPERFDKVRKVVRELALRKDTAIPIVFDNLSIEQLGLKEILPEEVWEYAYLGDEGSCSMYIDAVEGKYARNSRSPERVGWDEIGLLDYFRSLR